MSQSLKAALTKVLETRRLKPQMSFSWFWRLLSKLKVPADSVSAEVQPPGS